MLYSLQKSIMERFNSSEADTLRGMVLGMYEDEAPSSVVLMTQTGESLKVQPKPFIVFSNIYTELAQTFCSNLNTELIQFTIYGDGNNKSSKPLLLISDEFLNVFGDVLLSIGGGYSLIRNDTVSQFKYKDSDNMWNIVIELEITVEKNR